MQIIKLDLSDELKARVKEAAECRGQSERAFMLDAIANATSIATARSVLRQRFVADALAAERDAMRGGELYTANEVFAYFEARAQGKRARKPSASR
jgi:predicted transcriptional regulator